MMNVYLREDGESVDESQLRDEGVDDNRYSPESPQGVLSVREAHEDSHGPDTERHDAVPGEGHLEKPDGPPLALVQHVDEASRGVTQKSWPVGVAEYRLPPLAVQPITCVVVLHQRPVSESHLNIQKAKERCARRFPRTRERDKEAFTLEPQLVMFS